MAKPKQGGVGEVEVVEVPGDKAGEEEDDAERQRNFGSFTYWKNNYTPELDVENV